jgi:hypothetical protein
MEGQLLADTEDDDDNHLQVSLAPKIRHCNTE